MTEIPTDIKEMATNVARRWYHEEWEPEEYIQKKLVEEIAKALMEERARCAAICRNNYPMHGDYYADKILNLEDA